MTEKKEASKYFPSFSVKNTFPSPFSVIDILFLTGIQYACLFPLLYCVISRASFVFHSYLSLNNTVILLYIHCKKKCINDCSLKKKKKKKCCAQKLRVKFVFFTCENQCINNLDANVCYKYMCLKRQIIVTKNVLF